MAKITLQQPELTVASDISGSITLTIPSNLNAWKASDKAGGAAPTSYALSDLPKDIYLEGKTASSDILDTVVKTEMTLNSGDGMRDDEDYTVVTQANWTEGSADTEDWSDPGHQSNN